MPARVGIALATLMATLMAACGAGSDDAEPGADLAQAQLATPVIATLLDDQGLPFPAHPEAVPADPGARTRNGLYATPAQAAQLEHALGAMAIPVTVEPGPDASTAVTLATQIVIGAQAAQDLPKDSPVLVRGQDSRLAAAAVNALVELGFERAFLVHQERDAGAR
jgi:hypothetical protein